MPKRCCSQNCWFQIRFEKGKPAPTIVANAQNIESQIQCTINTIFPTRQTLWRLENMSAVVDEITQKLLAGQLRVFLTTT